MEHGSTPEQIIASVLHLPSQQRRLIANAIMGSLNELEQGQELSCLLIERIGAVDQGRFSKKTFSQIKREARSKH